MTKAFFLLLLAATAAAASVVKTEVSGNSVHFKLSDGEARLDWLSPVAFSWYRVPAGVSIPDAQSREGIAFTPAEQDGWLQYATRYIRVEVSRLDTHLRVYSASGQLLRDDQSKPAERRWGSDEGFVLSALGYGEFRTNTTPPERRFYYGPSLKEVLEQHMLANGQPDGLGPEVVDVLRPSQRPRESSPPLNVNANSWDALRDVVRRLLNASMEAVLYPSVDLALFSGPAQARAEQLATFLPIVLDSRSEPSRMAARDPWKPYLVTYFREARDRGFPIIRPLMLQFPRDPQSPAVDDEFLLGDELLVAPVISEQKTRTAYLPMGYWTDLRTNIEYKGRQSVSVEVTPSAIPVFARNGSLLPIASKRGLELHYFPKLGSEFFLWEPEVSDISQFHANPILGDILRFESEARIGRDCEWIAHHYAAPKSVKDASSAYTKVAERRLLRPGTWFHDSEHNNLHVMSRAEPNGDEIINVYY
ncbi:MAG: hypothetical protein ABI823_02755 [Bryobacteraceae bacterium]